MYNNSQNYNTYDLRQVGRYSHIRFHANFETQTLPLNDNPSNTTEITPK